MTNLIHHIVKLFSPRGEKFYSFIYDVTGIKPRHIELYRRALTHKSVISRNHANFSQYNERLEYLGDALLSAIVAEFLYKAFPSKDEGALTKMRSKIVSRNRLNDVALKMNLHEHVKTQTQKPLDQTHILGDSLEAIIGATYLDHGYQKCRTFVIQKIINPFIDLEEIAKNDGNYKSLLIEWGHKNHRSVNFITEEKHTSDEKEAYFVAFAQVSGTKVGEGEGQSKKEAQQKAAYRALRELENNPKVLNRPKEEPEKEENN